MPKRQSGYVATVKVFVPVDTRDLKDQIAKAQALDVAAEHRSLGELADVGAEVVSITHRYTTRRMPEA